MKAMIMAGGPVLGTISLRHVWNEMTLVLTLKFYHGMVDEGDICGLHFK